MPNILKSFFYLFLLYMEFSNNEFAIWVFICFASFKLEMHHAYNFKKMITSEGNFANKIIF